MDVKALADAFSKISPHTGPVEYGAGGPVVSPSQKSDFWGSLGHSITQIPSALNSTFVQPVQKAFNDVGTGIADVLPKVGMIAQDTKNLNVRQSGLDAAMKSAQTAYKQGKIGKARYNALVKDINKEYDAAINERSDRAAEYTKPKDFAMGTATIAGLAASAGSLEASPLLAGSAEGDGALATLAQAGQFLERNVGGIKATAQAAAKTAEGSDLGLMAGKGILPTVLKAPIKAAAIDVPTAQMPVNIASDIKNKNYAGAAGQLALVAGGEAASRLLPKAGEVISTALNGKQGLFDAIKLKDGTTVNQHLAQLKTLAETGDKASVTAYKKAVNVAKVAQDNILTQYGGDVKAAARALKEWQAETGSRALEATDPQQFIKDLGEFASASRTANRDATSGALLMKDANAPGGTRALTAAEQSQVGVGRLSVTDKAQLANTLSTATAEEAQKVLSDVNNKNVRAQLESILTTPVTDASGISRNKTPEEIKAAINSITGTTPLVGGSKLPNGYFHILRPEGSAPFNRANQVGEVVQGKDGALQALGNRLKKMGMGTDNVAQGELSDAIKANFKDEANKIPELTGSSDKVYRALYAEASGKTGAYDPRMLTKNEIGKVLEKNNINPTLAGDVRKALDNAYNAVPLELRGAGPKVADTLISKIPGGRIYLRAQAAGRFGPANIFFGGKVATKSALLSLSESGGQGIGSVGGDIGKFVSQAGGRTIDSGVAEFLGGEVPNVKPGVIGKIQQNLAENMVKSVLEKNKLSVADLQNNPQLKNELTHAVQMIYGYPKGGALDTNLAKTLNVVLFPSRFEAKVLGAGVKFLAKQPPITRAAIINSLVGGAQWTQTPEGQKWQQDNAELLGVMKYFTPVGTLEGLHEFITNGQHLSDVGQVGGLPLGVITQMLEGQGVNLGKLGSSDYRNPKTGELASKTIPDSAKARMQQGLTDLISSLFSYPGRTLGLTKKSDVITTVAPFLKQSPSEQRKVGGVANLPSGKLAPPKSYKAVDRLAPVNIDTRSQAAAAKASAPALQRTPRIRKTKFASPRLQ